MLTLLDFVVMATDKFHVTGDNRLPCFKAGNEVSNEATLGIHVSEGVKEVYSCMHTQRAITDTLFTYIVLLKYSYMCSAHSSINH